MFKFVLPDIGEGVTEGEIVKWIIKEGDELQRDQDMVEIMTDKVNINIPSPVQGKVTKILYKEGQVVKVGEAIIEIDDGSGSPAKPKANEEKTEPANEQEKEEKDDEVKGGEMKMESSGDQNRRILASPTIRRIAKDRGIDLDSITPSGPNGRVTLEDLDRAEREMNQKKEQPKPAVRPVEPPKPAARPITPPNQQKQQVTEEPKPAESRPEQEEKKVQPKPEKEVKPEGPKAPESPPPVTKVESPVVQEVSHAEGDQLIEMHGLRRIIFDKMTKSKQIMPHFTVGESVNIGLLTKTMNDMREKGTKVSLTPFFVKAVAVTLTEFPKFNAHYDEQNKSYLMRKDINIGVAIDTPSGLTVAVVRNAIDKSVVQISNEIADLAKKARENKLSLADVQDSTFTVSNVGSIGGLFSTPIINYPEVAILAVHRSTKNGSNFEKGDDQTILSLSCDHRLIDGADAARFVVKVKGYLEDPISFLIR